MTVGGGAFSERQTYRNMKVVSLLEALFAYIKVQLPPNSAYDLFIKVQVQIFPSLPPTIPTLRTFNPEPQNLNYRPFFLQFSQNPDFQKLDPEPQILTDIPPILTLRILYPKHYNLIFIRCFFPISPRILTVRILALFLMEP